MYGHESSYDDLLWPTLKSVERLGGSASVGEILEETKKVIRIAPSFLEAPHGETNQTELGYRLAWARTYLKHIGALENSARGVWSITSGGRTFQSEQLVKEEIKKFRNERSLRKKLSAAPISEEVSFPEGAPIDELTADWRQRLLDCLKALEPSTFERLCQRLLREAGFVEVEVTGRTGDGGIDGVGILKINLLSFHVAFQCKRYRDVVGPEEVREFRGSLMGRADKGLVITTGRFTTAAQREAVRDGASAIDLVDGDGLCDLLKKYELGVKTKLVETNEIVSSFFESL